MANTLSRMRVAVLGAGKIGGILLQGFIKHHLISRDRDEQGTGESERLYPSQGGDFALGMSSDDDNAHRQTINGASQGVRLWRVGSTSVAHAAVLAQIVEKRAKIFCNAR